MTENPPTVTLKGALATSIASPKSQTSPRDRAQARRRLREQGLKPIEIWVPDIDSPGFAAEARRQSLLVANSPEEKEDQAFIDSIADHRGWEWNEE